VAKQKLRQTKIATESGFSFGGGGFLRFRLVRGVLFPVIIHFEAIT